MGNRAFALLICGLISGCGGPSVVDSVEQSDLFPVVGKIDLDGQPIPDASVMLYPAEGTTEALPNPPMGVVSPDGTFEIYTYRDGVRGKGCPAGEYRAYFSWSGSLAGLTESQRDELAEKLPKKFLHPRSSGITVSVTPGVGASPEISLTSK